MSRPLVIYHSPCADGFTAAWVAARALLDVELFEGRYGEEPPYELAAGRNVFVVDFSYSRQQTILLGQRAKKLFIFDHHKTAKEALEGLSEEIPDSKIIFDMERSGAGITWDFFHPDIPRPWIVKYVEDRDLWRFNLPDCEEISLYIRCEPQTLRNWDLMRAQTLTSVMAMAEGCRRHLQHYIEDAMRQAYPVTITYVASDHELLQASAVAVNVSYTGVSDVLNEALAQNPEINVAIGWHRATDGKLNCSLRSTRNFDCSKIAKWFDGGGHAQASGFRLDVQSDLACELLGV